MKRLIRTAVFSIVGVYLTSLWNQGFIVNTDFWLMFKFALLFTFVFSIIRPILKLILFPINFFTFGLVGSFVNLLLFFFVFKLFPQMQINSWHFQGGWIFGFHLPEMYISHAVNFILVIFSISFFVSLLDFLT